MLKIMNFPNQYQIGRQQNLKKNNSQEQETSNINSFELAGYKTGRAILANSGINFKGRLEPLDITSRYNKKTEGNAHLDLPNIHVYEYPDTNLQVFLNEVPNMENKNIFHASLSLKNKHMNNFSIIKQKLFMEIMKKAIKENGIDANVNENYTNFINIDFEGPNSDINNIKVLNKLINSSNITQEQLKESKNILIKYINSEKYEKDTYEIKNNIDKSLLYSKEDTIKEIQNITLNDMHNYCSDILKNTEIQYFLTIDKDYMRNNKSEIFNILNSNISNKFQKHSDNKNIPLKPIKHLDNIKILDDKNQAYLTFHYPINIESNKDKLIYKYLTLLEIFWKNPYVSENSGGEKYQLPFELKNKEVDPKTLGFLEFSFTPTGNENIVSTDNSIEVFKAILESLYYEKLSVNTLESIKEVEKERYAELLNDKCDKDSHEILQNYGYDVFKIYETIDDIKIEDIRNAIEKNFFEQNPIVIINENLNPFN